MPDNPETKPSQRPGRRKVLALIAATGLAAGGWFLGKNNPSPDKQEVNAEVDPQRKTDIQIYRDAIFTWINQDTDKESFAKIFSDEFVNQKLPPVPEEPNGQRLRIDHQDTRVYINPKVRSENQPGETVSYGIRTSPMENNEQRQGIPAIYYGKDTYQGLVVHEGISGIVSTDNKFTSLLTKGEDPKNQEDEANEAEELRDRVKKIFKFTPEEWSQFEWDTYNNPMRNTNGVPQFGVEGTWENDGKRYQVRLIKSGAVSLTIDHRPKNFGFPKEYYDY